MRTTRSERPDAPPFPQSVSVLVHPDQVLDHPAMGVEEKRATLSSWASDLHAVENAPALRRLDSGAVVPVDDILAALAALSADQPAGDTAPAWAASERRQRPSYPAWRKSPVRTRGSLPPPGGGRAARGG